jgi:hypothetical protein
MWEGIVEGRERGWMKMDENMRSIISNGRGYRDQKGDQ